LKGKLKASRTLETVTLKAKSQLLKRNPVTNMIRRRSNKRKQNLNVSLVRRLIELKKRESTLKTWLSPIRKQPMKFNV